MPALFGEGNLWVTKINYTSDKFEITVIYGRCEGRLRLSMNYLYMMFISTSIILSSYLLNFFLT